MWCPKCKTEYRAGITVCTDCGTELVDEKQEEMIDICEIMDEKMADEVIEFLSYSGIKTLEKVSEDKESGFKILVAISEAKKAEKNFKGYLLAKEEEQENEEKNEESQEDSFDNNEMEQDETEEFSVMSSDTIDEDASDLLHSTNKKEYVKKEDYYKDIKFSGITFIAFGIVGIIYLILCQTKMIPITYNIVVFCIIAALFAGFVIGGIVSLIKASKIKVLIPKEEEKTKEIKEWLCQNITEEKITQWEDTSVTDMENDLLIAAHIRNELVKNYPNEVFEYLEMLADEYFEENIRKDQ